MAGHLPGHAERAREDAESVTGAYLTGTKSIDASHATSPGKALVIRGARENNLKSIDVRLPLGVFVAAVTGVSGSASRRSSTTSSIVRSRRRSIARDEPGAHDRIDGIELVDKVIEIDQSPIGRTPRSNPATYTGLFAFIRDLFAMMPEARQRGFRPGRFRST